MPRSNGQPGATPEASISLSSDTTVDTRAAHTAPHLGDNAADSTHTAPTIAQVVNNIFAKFDADSSGTITLSEWLGVVDPSGASTTLGTSFSNLLAKIDGNADGTLSKDEITSAVTALDTDSSGTLDRADSAALQAGADTTGSVTLLLHPAAPADGHMHPTPLNPPTPLTIGQATDAVFTVYDADASSTLSLSELLAVLDPGASRPTLDARLTAWLGTVDSNADATLSKAEITAALTLLDTNLDGSLSHADFVPGQAHDGRVDLIGVLLHHAEGPPGGA